MRSALLVVVALGFPALGLAQDGEAEAEQDEAVEQFEPLDVPRGAQAADSESAQDAGKAKPEGEEAARSGPPVWWVGPFIDGVIIPGGFLKLFLDEAPTVANPSFGVTISHRDAEGFAWTLGLGYTGYGFDGPFRITGDPEIDTEYVDSSLGLLHVRGQLTWSAEISKKLAFEYGVGVDLGLVLGELKRSEAYLDPNGEYAPCRGDGDPPSSQGYCEPTTNGQATNAFDEEGAHYGVVEERVPPIAGSIMLPVLALRFTPIEKLAIRLEVAYQILQLSFGISAAYGLE
jgi:hypothetical protein